MTAKRPPKKAPAKAGAELIDVNTILGIDDAARKVLLIELATSAVFVRDRANSAALEKERKRCVEKLRTNALRLLEAVQALDDDSLDYVGFSMMGGDDTMPLAQRRVAELKSIRPFQTFVENLRGLSVMKPDALPKQRFSRPELLIAADVVKALLRAGLTATAADTGIAADCFRHVAAMAGINASESPRYWINKAKNHPEI